MSILRHRIRYGGTDDGVKAGTEQINDLTVVGLNMGATDIPLVRIRVNGPVITSEELQPLITADGAPVSATMAGSWGQLYAAGRMS